MAAKVYDGSADDPQIQITKACSSIILLKTECFLLLQFSWTDLISVTMVQSEDKQRRLLVCFRAEVPLLSDVTLYRSLVFRHVYYIVSSQECPVLKVQNSINSN